MNQSPLRRAVDDFTFDAQPTPVEQARTQAMTQNSLARGFRQDALASEADALNRQALEAEAAGDPNWQTYRAQAQAKQQEAAEFSSAVPSFRDIRSVGDAMEYAGHTIGSAAGSMLPSIAGAAAGRVLTPFKAAKDAVSALGAAAPAYQREVGAQAGRQYDDPNQMAHSAELRHDMARLTGAGSAALEAVVPQSIARSALSPSQRIARSVGREALEEGATETAQEALTHQAGSVFGSQDELTGAELLDAAVGGAIGGAGVSAGARIPGAALQQGTQYLANTVRDGVDSVQSTMSQRSAEAESIRQQYEALNQQKQDSYVDRLINKSAGVPDSLGDLADSARADLADTPAEQLRGASFEETERNLAADDEARAARAQQYAEAILADDATPPATRQLVESALQDLSNPDNRAQIAGIMARKADLEQVKRASEDLDSLLPKDDKIIKHSLAGMPASMDAQITDTLIQHMKPELANSMSAKELAELSTFGKKLVAFSTRVDDTALDRSDAETLFRLGETMDMFQDPEATIAALQQIGGVQSMGMAPGANWINQVRAVRSASTDVDEPMSFLSLMLKDADLPPQNVKLVAKAVDQFTALENAGKTEKATAFRNALVEVFGSPQNVDTVLQYYAKKNSQSLVQASEAHAMLADPDSGVQERGGDFGVNYEDAKAQRPYFRPARTIEKGEQALKATLGENATLKRRSYWDVAQEKGLDAKQERSRLATDLKGRIAKAEKSLQGDKPEFQEMRKQAIRRMQGELYYLESDMYPDEDVLNQYEVIETGSGEVDTTVAQDSDLKGMSALLKDPSAAKTKITFKKKDGKTLQLSAESMWRAWAKKNGTPIPENKRAVQEAFGDALAAVMARPDIEGFAEGQDMKGILIHRGLQLPATFPNVKKQGMKTHEIGQRIKRNEKVTPEERERHDKAKKRRYARERAAESNPYTSVVAEVLQGIERGIEGKQITKAGKTTRHEYVDHREKIQEFSDYLASEADHWTAVIDSETTPAAKYEARTQLAQVRDAQAQIREAVSDAEFTFRDENRAGTPEPDQSDSRPRKYEEDTGAPIGHGRAPGSVKDPTGHGDGKVPSTEYVAVASTVDEAIKEVAQRARNMKFPLLRDLARYVQVDPYLPTAGRATKDGRILISPKVLTDTVVRERLGQRFPMIKPDQLVDVILAHEMFHQIDRNLGHISHKMEATFNAVMQVRDTLPWLDYLTDEMSPQSQRREVFAQIMALDTYAPEYLKEAFPKGAAFAKKVREYIDAQPTPPTSPRGTRSDSAERQAPQEPGRRAEQGKPAARQTKTQQGARSEVADIPPGEREAYLHSLFQLGTHGIDHNVGRYYALSGRLKVDNDATQAVRMDKDGFITVSGKLFDPAVAAPLMDKFLLKGPTDYVGRHAALIQVLVANKMHKHMNSIYGMYRIPPRVFNELKKRGFPYTAGIKPGMTPTQEREAMSTQILALHDVQQSPMQEDYKDADWYAQNTRQYRGKQDARQLPPFVKDAWKKALEGIPDDNFPPEEPSQGSTVKNSLSQAQKDQLALDDSRWGSRPQEFAAMEKTVTQLVKRLRGDNVITQFLRHADMLDYKTSLGLDKNDSSVGLYVADPVRRTRTVSVSSVADDPMVTAAHEAFHDFMTMLKAELTPEARRLHKLLLEANRNKDLVAQLKQYKKTQRDAAQTNGTLKEFDDYLFNDPEEFVTTLLEGYYAGKIKLDSAPVIRTVFDQILDWLRKLVGAADRPQIYKETFDAFLNGKFADDRMTTSLKTFSTSKTLSEKIRHAGAPLSRLYSALMDTALDQLRASGSPSLVQLSHLFFRDVEFAGEKSDTKLPFLQARQQQHSKWLNRLSEILAGAEESEVKAALTNLQSMKDPESDLEKAITELLADMHKYMDQAGVQVFDPQKKIWRALGKVDRYFPRVWDKELIRRNEEKFRQLLIPHIGEKQADATIKAITAGDGSLDLSESEKSMGFTPYADSVQNRQFTFIDKTNAHQFAEFQTQDMAYILASYIQKATHRAEYARSFGNDGAVISKLLAQALNEGVDEKEMGRAIKAVKAMEGTLGQGMSDGLKSLFGGIISFQNLVLLPTALFSSLVDPLGISVKTGDFQHAKRAFMNGLKELKKQLSPFVPEGGPTEEERIARLLGTIDDENMLQLLGTQYQAGYLGTGLKKANAWFFRANGMEGWNRAMRVTATTIARETIPTYLQGGQWNKLRELGVTKKSFIRTTQDGKLMVEEEDFKAAGFSAVEARQAATEAQAAVMRWVDSVILRPHAGHRPAWGSDPMWSLAFHLKQFTWSFQNTILRGQFDKLKAGDRSALKPLLAYIPFSMASILAKGLLIGTAIPTDAGVMTARATERSGLLGTHEIAAKALMDIANGKPPMDLLGPTGEHVQSLLLAMADGQVTPGEADSMLDRSVPFHKLAGDRLGASLAR